MPEGTRQREAFDAYYAIGRERSLVRLHEQLSTDWDRAPSLRTLEEWSRLHHWQHRLADIERASRESADEERIAAIREMQARHAREALLLQQKGTEWLTAIAGGDASAEAAIRAIAEGARLERTARGEIETTHEDMEAGDPRLEEFTNDELERLIDAARGVARDAEAKS